MQPDDDRPTRSLPTSVRQTYSVAAQLVVDLVAHPAVVSAWDDPSCLPDTPLPQPATEAVTAAVDVLVTAARERHGDHAVLLALSRREHDLVEALRVL